MVMDKKGFFTAFGAFLLLLLSGFAIGAYHAIKAIVHIH